MAENFSTKLISKTRRHKKGILEEKVYYVHRRLLRQNHAYKHPKSQHQRCLWKTMP